MNTEFLEILIIDIKSNSPGLVGQRVYTSMIFIITSKDLAGHNEDLFFKRVQDGL